MKIAIAQPAWIRVLRKRDDYYGHELEYRAERALIELAMARRYGAQRLAKCRKLMASGHAAMKRASDPGIRISARLRAAELADEQFGEARSVAYAIRRTDYAPLAECQSVRVPKGWGCEVRLTRGWKVRGDRTGSQVQCTARLEGGDPEIHVIIWTRRPGEADSSVPQYRVRLARWLKLHGFKRPANSDTFVKSLSQPKDIAKETARIETHLASMQAQPIRDR